MRREDIEDLYPLSPMQQGMLFHTLLAPGSGVYFEQFTCRIQGKLDEAAFEHAWQRVLDRHTILRTAFVWQGLREPHQVVLRRVTLPFHHEDWRHLSADERERRLARFVADDRARGFDLSRAPLIRLDLFQAAEESHLVVWRFHHLLLDGWSGALLLREVFLLYEGLRLGREPELPPARPYRDYIAWLKRQDLAKAEAFWRRELAGFRAPTPLGVDRPAAGAAVEGEGDGYAKRPSRLTPEVTGMLRSLARRHQITLNTLAFGAWALLLSLYSGEEDVVFGVTSSGRPVEIEGIDTMIGLFINTLPARVQVDAERELIPWLRDLQLRQVEARQYEYAPLMKVQEWSEVPPHLPLFESIQGLESFPLTAFESDAHASLDVWEFRAYERTNYPLTVLSSIVADALKLEIWCEERRFDPATIQRMLGHLRTLLEAITDDPERPLWALPILDEAERRQFADWNATEVPFPAEAPLPTLLRQQVERTPEGVAVLAGETRVSFRDLDRAANRLAHHLRALGAGPDVPVAVCLERSPAMIVAVLAILKAGGAYLPLDSAQPAERLAALLADAAPAALVTAERLLDRFEAARVATVCIDRDREAIARRSEEEPRSGVGADNLAYVIYTSGSTGLPKGVMIDHRSLVNHCVALARSYGLGPEDRLLQFVSLTFDASAEEIFPALLSGAALVLPPTGASPAGAALRELCEQQEVSVLHVPTSFWHQWVEDLAAGGGGPVLPALRILHVGGEAVALEKLRSWADLIGRPFRFYNGYGPTETTILATCFAALCDPGLLASLEQVPIGRPFANRRAYVLERHLRPVPIGVTGELCLGGLGLARGYLGRPDLTAERLVPDCFAAVPGARMYRTGDLARWRPDGSLEFLGRSDDQVKIRGVRVEPAEVETALRRHPAVLDAVVAARNLPDGGHRLVAWVVPRPGKLREEAPAGLDDEQVSQWNRLFESNYGEVPLERDPLLNFTGWNSSYTGLPIPDEEMGEWVEATAARILSLRPRRVLELGCGGALLLLRIAPACERYVGTDFSAQALGYVRHHLERRGGPGPVELKQAAADEIGDLADGSFDVVVLNSVVQYFPSVDYLLRVLAGAVRAVRPGGAIFLGDIRNLSLLPALQASVQLFQAPPSLPVEVLRQRVRERIEREEELLVDPTFFHALPRLLPGLAGVEVLLKQGRADNELTKFRYDVILRLEPTPPPVEVDWLDWRERSLTLEAVAELAAGDGPLALAGVPNARVAAELSLVERLAATSADTVAGLLAQLREQPAEGVDPEGFRTLGERSSRDVEILWAGPGRPGCYDVLLLPRSHGERGLLPLSWSAGALASRPLAELASDPLRGVAAHHLERRLREDLHARLPESFVPSAFVLLDALPLTRHDKVDRRALPDPDGARSESRSRLVPPRDRLELEVAQVWEQVLDVRPIGVLDNWFDLGGNSLLAARLTSELKVRLGHDLPLSELLAAPTVERVAAALRQRSAGGPPRPRSPVVPLQTAAGAGAKAPFYWVHPAGGSALCYAALVRHLDPLRPGFGVQARGLEPGEEPLQSVAEMAELYVEALVSHRPSGPFLLGGWSLGGVVAHEVARRLAGKGRKVELLVLLDAYAEPPAAARGEISDATLLELLLADFSLRTGQRLPEPPEGLRGLPTEEALSAVFEAAAASHLLPAGFGDAAALRRHLAVLRANLRAQADHRPQLFPGRTVLFTAAQAVEDAPADRGWTALVAALEVRPTPGDHFSILAPVQVSSLAVRLRRVLDRSATAEEEAAPALQAAAAGLREAEP